MLKLYLGDYNMKKGLAVFSGSAVVHKLMQDGTVVLGTAANPASVTISGSLTASANSVEVGNVGGEFTNHTLGGILVELKNSGSASSGSLKSYIDAQDIVVGNAAAAALGAYTASNDAALATETAARIAGDSTLQTNLNQASSSIKTYVDGLDSAQTSARNAVSSSMKSYIDAQDLGVSGSLKGYVDQKISDLVNGAPAVLDTLKEIADSLNNSGSLATTLAGQIAQVQTNLDSVSSSLTQEVADRIADVDAEEARAMGVEATLTTAISAEQTRAEGVEADLAIDIAAEQTRAEGVEAGLQDQIDAEVSARTSADSTEQAARIAGDLAVQSDLDAYKVLNDAALSAEVIRATGAEATLTSDLAAEVIRATGAESVLTADLAAEVIRATAAEGALGVRIDGVEADLVTEQERAEAAEVELASDIAEVASDLAAEITNRIADVDAEQERAEAAELVLTQAVAAEVVRAELAEAGLQSAINTEKDRIDAILSGSTVDLDQFKEVVDFVNSIDTTNQSALISSIAAVNATASQMRADFSEYTSSNDAALDAEVSRASGVEAGLQSQIDASAFTVNGLSVLAKSGSFTIVTGSSNNLSIVNNGSEVKVDLNSSITLAGALSANTLTASAGLSVVGGASVADGMTVSSGDMKVSQGAMSVKMTREEAVARGPGEDGDMFYCTSATDNPASAFPRGSCWYFKQGGEWFDAPFFMG